MKEFIFLFVLISSIFPCQKEKNTNENEINNSIETGLLINPVFKGRYDVAGNLFLVELKITNKTNSTVKFLTYSCSAVANVITDSKKIDICPNVCSRNFKIRIVLNPGQEFRIPVILETTVETSYNKIRIGWIMIDDNGYNSEHFDEVLVKSSEDFKNVIWSDPFTIEAVYGQIYEIK
jgi:hypothetical protein